MLESGPWPRSMSIAGLVSAGAARLPLPHGQDQCRCEQQQAAQHREGIALTHDHRLFAEDLTECHERLLLRRSPIADPVARRTRPPRSRSWRDRAGSAWPPWLQPQGKSERPGGPADGGYSGCARHVLDVSGGRVSTVATTDMPGGPPTSRPDQARSSPGCAGRSW
jgi:hypothetical protein